MTEPTIPQPPTPPEGMTPPGPSGPRASFWSRLLALLLDWVIVIVGALFLIIVLAIIGDEGGALIGALIALVLAIAYFTYFQGGPTGQTPGKRMCNIRVIDANTGGPIGYARSLGRVLFAWLISSFLWNLGYLWMIWDKEKQTWHDKVTSAVVVPTSAYPVR
jgi:uncharacterized RDD family membrane protein YckC